MATRVKDHARGKEVDKRIIDVFVQMAKLTPANPTEKQSKWIGAALNCFMDGSESMLTGTHQGWNACADESLAEIDWTGNTPEDPEALMHLAVNVLGSMPRGVNA